MAKSHTNSFTEEQVEQLKANQYVRSVSSSTVRFTVEFRKHFYQKRKSGKSTRQIFLECGIDPDILGEKRISGFCYALNKYAKREEGFSDKKRRILRCSPMSTDQTVEERLKHVEHELAYTRQEVEFLKKNQMADMEARKRWESRHQPK